MQILSQELVLEGQSLSHQRGLYVPMHQRSTEFRCRYTPAESDPTKTRSVEEAADQRSMPASRHASGARRP